MNIDVHIHIVGTGCCNSGIWLAPNFRRRYTFKALRWLLGISKESLTSTADLDWVKRISAMVADSPIDFGVVLGFDGFYDWQDGHRHDQHSQLVVPAEWVFKVCRDFKNLLPGPSINPFRSDALQQLQFCIDQKAVLIKWLPAAQGIDPTHVKMAPFFKMLADSGIPLLVHMGGERTFASIMPELNNVDLLAAPLDAGVKVICAHSATRIIGSSEPDQLPKLKKLLGQYPNLWLDNSGLCNPGRFAHVPKLAKDPLITERTLYGSDWPVPSNAFYYWRQLGWRQVRALDKNPNMVTRDLTVKRLLGYPDATLTRASQVLANLDHWT